MKPWPWHFELLHGCQSKIQNSIPMLSGVHERVDAARVSDERAVLHGLEVGHYQLAVHAGAEQAHAHAMQHSTVNQKLRVIIKMMD